MPCFRAQRGQAFKNPPRERFRALSKLAFCPRLNFFSFIFNSLWLNQKMFEARGALGAALGKRVAVRRVAFACRLSILACIHRHSPRSGQGLRQPTQPHFLHLKRLMSILVVD
jgi:hypothetical protein